MPFFVFNPGIRIYIIFEEKDCKYYETELDKNTHSSLVVYYILLRDFYNGSPI